MAGSSAVTLISYRFLFLGTNGTWNTSRIQIYSPGQFLISRTGLYIMSNSWIQVAHNTSWTLLTLTPRLLSLIILEEGCRQTPMYSMDQTLWTSPLERISLTSPTCHSPEWTHSCSPLISSWEIRVSWVCLTPSTSRSKRQLWIVTSTWAPPRCKRGLLSNTAAASFSYLLAPAVRIRAVFRAGTYTHHTVLMPTCLETRLTGQ